MHRILALLVALLFAAPLAAADQDIEVGPVAVTTLNHSSGDGCDGENGSDQRHASVTVTLTEWDDVVLLFRQSCSTYSQEHPGGVMMQRDEGLVLMAGKRSDGNAGPYAQASTWDSEYEDDFGATRWCGSTVYVAGPALHLGCLPNNMRVPMLPQLP